MPEQKVSGGQQYIGQYLNKALVSAEDEAKRWEMNMSLLNIYFGSFK